MYFIYQYTFGTLICELSGAHYMQLDGEIGIQFPFFIYQMNSIVDKIIVH